ncbi:MAG: hypothetical protein DA329_07350 [Candidatus Nitrosocosmicus sp.]|nr:hypothetical protein [Candidatus Nitrosocosmicus sp.]
MLSAREFLYFEPFWVFQLPIDWIPSFALIIVVAGLTSIVTSLAIYQVRMLKANSQKSGVGLVGSVFGVGAGVCTSCGPIGFSIITTFGVAGASTLSFLYDYEIPIRLGAIAILGATYFIMIKGITRECKLSINKK